MRSDYKELVWKDLCGRLPYGVRCYVPTHDEVMRLTGQRLNYLCFHKDSFGLDYSHEIETVLDPWNSDIIVRPYLRPLSSMTKKEKKEYANLEEYNYVQAVDWMYEHYFDCRGLIEKGLAYEAPKICTQKEKEYDKRRYATSYDRHRAETATQVEIQGGIVPRQLQIRERCS